MSSHRTSTPLSEQPRCGDSELASKPSTMAALIAFSRRRAYSGSRLSGHAPFISKLRLSAGKHSNRTKAYDDGCPNCLLNSCSFWQGSLGHIEGARSLNVRQFTM